MVKKMSSQLPSVSRVRNMALRMQEPGNRLWPEQWVQSNGGTCISSQLAQDHSELSGMPGGFDCVAIQLASFAS